MNNILQLQENALLSYSKAVQPGRPIGLMLHFKGVNAALTTSTISDLGDLIMKRQGRTLINRRIKSLERMSNIRFGANYFSSAEAGAFEATIFVPFFEEGLRQSLNIVGDDELVVGYNPNTGTPANFASLNCTVYTVEGYQTLPEFYEYYILGDDQSISGAVNKPYQLNDDNITALFVEDGDDIVSEIGLRSSGNQVVSATPWAVLEGQTLLFNKLESITTFPMVELQMFSAGEAASYVNDRNVIEIETSGAGLVEISKCFIIPNQNFSALIGG